MLNLNTGNKIAEAILSLHMNLKNNIEESLNEDADVLIKHFLIGLTFITLSCSGYLLHATRSISEFLTSLVCWR